MQPEQIGEAGATVDFGRGFRDELADLGDTRLGVARGEVRIHAARVLRIDGGRTASARRGPPATNDRILCAKAARRDRRPQYRE